MVVEFRDEEARKFLIRNDYCGSASLDILIEDMKNLEEDPDRLYESLDQSFGNREDRIYYFYSLSSLRSSFTISQIRNEREKYDRMTYNLIFNTLLKLIGIF